MKPIAIYLWLSFFSGMANAQVLDSLQGLVVAQSGEAQAQTFLQISALLTLQKPDSALVYANWAEKGFVETKNTDGLIKAYLQKVEVLNNTRKNKEALSVAQKALEMAKKQQNASLLGDVYAKYGSAYYMANDIDPCTEMYYKALRQYEIAKDTLGLIASTGNLAIVYQKSMQYEKAKEMYFSALGAQQALGQKSPMVRTFFNIALLYNTMSENDSCLIYASKTIELGKELGSGFAQAKGYAIGGNALIKLERYNEAFEYLNEAYTLTKNTPFHNETQRTYLDIGYAHHYTGNHAKAIEIGKDILAAPQVFDFDNTYRLLYLAQKAGGNFKESLHYLEGWKSYRDSTQRIMQAQKFDDLQTKYETEKKEAKIVALAKESEIAELESKQNRNYFLGASMIGLLILGISIIAYNQLRLRRKADLAQEQLKNSQKTMKLENQFREAELKALKSQMNPHFIFNALNSIQEYIILNDKENAANYLGKFADLIRNYLYHSNMGKLSLADELESLKLYLELEQVRFEEDFTFEIKKSIQDSAENIEIPTMLIQPYVENAIKHGLLHKSGEKKLLLQFIERENSLDCEIIDNGVGRAKSGEINAKRRKGHQSFATEATQSRLELLNHQSDSKIGVEIIDLIDGSQALGTKVVIRIPKQ